jgi:hypothetical protein
MAADDHDLASQHGIFEDQRVSRRLERSELIAQIDDLHAQVLEMASVSGLRSIELAAEQERLCRVLLGLGPHVPLHEAQGEDLPYLARAVGDYAVGHLDLGGTSSRRNALQAQTDAVAMWRRCVHPAWTGSENLFDWSKRNYVMFDEINSRWLKILQSELVLMADLLDDLGRDHEAGSARDEAEMYKPYPAWGPAPA